MKKSSKTHVRVSVNPTCVFTVMTPLFQLLLTSKHRCRERGKPLLHADTFTSLLALFLSACFADKNVITTDLKMVTNGNTQSFTPLGKNDACSVITK